MALSRRNFIKGLLALSVVAAIPAIPATEESKKISKGASYAFHRRESITSGWYSVHVIREGTSVKTYVNGKLYRTVVVRTEEECNEYVNSLVKLSEGNSLRSFVTWDRALTEKQINSKVKIDEK